jgi:pimeloyl-ACP methyl ester carboxylesterase
MPVVLVHGVPETPAIWNQVRSHLARDDVVALQLPGFGCTRPEGFDATKEEYVDWLVDQIAGLQADGPVDLVGHDWGGAFVLRLVSLRPDLVRSWVTDAAGIGSVDFEWHDIAKVWQTPGVGEEFWQTQLAGTAVERGTLFEAFGVPHAEAVAIGAAIDETMAESILALYRSATAVGKEWGPDFHDIPAPGLTLIPVEDFLLDVGRARSAAARAGAVVVELPGAGHWWMTQDPANGAAVLEKFWAGVT